MILYRQNKASNTSGDKQTNIPQTNNLGTNFNTASAMKQIERNQQTYKQDRFKRVVSNNPFIPDASSIRVI